MRTTKTHPDTETTAQADALPPAETMAAPAAPARELPSLELKDSLVEADFVSVRYQLKGRLANERALVATMYREEMEKWKESSPKWKEFATFQAQIDEANRDLQTAEQAAAAAKADWERAIHTGGDVASLERNRGDAERQVQYVKERLAIVQVKDKERRAEIEAAWKRHCEELLRERRKHCERLISEAREYLARTTSVLAVTTINEEMRLLLLLSLGAHSTYGLAPRLF